MSTPGAEEMGYVLPGEAGVVNTDRSREGKGERLVYGRERQRAPTEFKSKPCFLLCVCTALAEESTLVPSTHVWCLTTPCNYQRI